ncbi:hypothetical protein ASPCAL00507 [Aspergillus calidoustus]|uniref:AMP-dependent synthetase/ligase domain-containing protein n=1 Tax=Aspergillus calidoustus TaxID=454130 RepID=A0A0U5FNS1_ASPCI|nr:hypothetical protein ASPCAL00507 [Aspergillus calidoustus]
MFPLADVLAVAKIHPFYNEGVEYPPDQIAIQKALRLGAEQAKEITLESFPLLTKKDLYHVIDRLLKDPSTGNEFRRSAYLSTTGGGSGALPLMFATDTIENRRHRADFGGFMRACQVIDSGDMVLTTHTSGHLYRSLDLISELLENAGASVLCAGSRMPTAEVVEVLGHYHANVLTGDSSQIVQVVHHISTLPPEQKKDIRLTKVIYTSDALTEAQESYIISVLGRIKILSILGSAEAGPFAISNPELTTESPPKGRRDFIFDTRAMMIEIHQPAVIQDDSHPCGKQLPLGEQGIIIQTSLQRLRNPIVKYITGDIGSLHSISDRARGKIPEAEIKHFQVLRLEGRDRRFSFKWFGEYFNFQSVSDLMQSARTGVLEWQIILDSLSSSPQGTLEVRIFRAADGGHISPREDFVRMIESFFWVFPENRHLFRVVFMNGLEGFEKSSTGRKIIRFVDRFN